MVTKITASVVIVGNEILSGRTYDKNLAFIAEFLGQQAIEVQEARFIADKKEQIISTINDLRKKTDYVFSTGGIGPTHDDITAEAVAEAFSVDLNINDESLAVLKKYYGTEKLTKAKMRMARIPDGAKLTPILDKNISYGVPKSDNF